MSKKAPRRTGQPHPYPVRLTPGDTDLLGRVVEKAGTNKHHEAREAMRRGLAERAAELGVPVAQPSAEGGP